VGSMGRCSWIGWTDVKKELDGCEGMTKELDGREVWKNVRKGWKGWGKSI
jgi:hypothetical protein